MRRLLIGSMLAVLLDWPAGAATVMDTRQFLDYLAGVSSRLETVWTAQVRLVANHLRGHEGMVGPLPLQRPLTCHVIPEYDPHVDKIVVGAVELPALLSYLQQVILFYVLGLDEVSSPEQIDHYVRLRLRPFAEARFDECGGSDAAVDIRRIEALSFFDPAHRAGRPYTAVLDDASVRPGAQRLADQIAAFPTFFAILHEAGHRVLHRQGTYDRQRREREADDFAVQAFRAGGGSITLGVPFLELLSMGSNQGEVACRIVALAKADTQADIDKVLGEFPAAYRRRVRALRDYYINRYQPECE